MATANALAPVTVPSIDRADWDSTVVDEGQHVLYGAYAFTDRYFEPLEAEYRRFTGSDSESHPATIAWDAMLEDVMREVHPKIADLFYEAISRRLPWTWEPER